MITFDLNLGSIIVGVVGAAITATLTYLVREVRRLIRLIERHEKVLFGDTDIQDWDGVVNICLANRRYSVNDRRAFIYLISILCKNKTLEMDSELSDALEQLKKG